MLSAVRSTIRHVLKRAGSTLNPTIAIDTFSEFQLKDIGLTRDHETVRARVGEVADPWHWSKEDTSSAPKPSPKSDRTNTLPAVTISPRAQPGENRDVSISLCG